MLPAHKIELRPTAGQADYLNRAFGAHRSHRYCFNQRLAHFKQDGLKWSKASAYQHFIEIIRPQFPLYPEVSARVIRNAIDDLDHAFKHLIPACSSSFGRNFGHPITLRTLTSPDGWNGPSKAPEGKPGSAMEADESRASSFSRLLDSWAGN